MLPVNLNTFFFFYNEPFSCLACEEGMENSIYFYQPVQFFVLDFQQ